MDHYWILTCEHASNAVPLRFRKLFEREKAFLETHRGYDIGAKHYATAISNKLSLPLICGRWTRLLVDLNRSRDNAHLLSSIIKPIDQRTREEILSSYYIPFRTKVRQLVQQKVAAGFRVIHVSCHSFTPILNGIKRNMDLGILYDSGRKKERAFARMVRQKLLEETSMRIRFNAPYKGTADGHVTALRKIFSEDQYIGIELEVNQSLYAPLKSELWQHVWLPRLIEALRVFSKE